MGSKLDPERLPEYRTRLSQLLAERDRHRTARNAFRVRQLNRLIQAQQKWIKNAEALITK